MKKLLATLLIFSIFMGFSTKTNAKDDKKEVIRITTYHKEGGAYRLFLGVRYDKIKTSHSIKYLGDYEIREYHVECLDGGWEKCRRGPTEYSPNLSQNTTTLLDDAEDQMLTSIEELIHNGKSNGTMVKKISQETGGTTKTYQIAIEWNNCDNSEYGGTIVSTITDITKHMPYTSTSTNATSNSALSH